MPQVSSVSDIYELTQIHRAAKHGLQECGMPNVMHRSIYLFSVIVIGVPSKKKTSTKLLLCSVQYLINTLVLKKNLAFFCVSASLAFHLFKYDHTVHLCVPLVLHLNFSLVIDSCLNALIDPSYHVLLCIIGCLMVCMS